ncbi:ABC transporter ATP-binding protein/permease [Candidatus Pelagibacter sp.]|nr:ABC transporter ATP-binding protein/permease [Candidatus Pelagibacter sp.]
MTNQQILKRLYSNYTKKYLSKIFIALILSIILAGSTSAIAYLLDPAIDKIFLNKDKSLILIIPFFIIIAFALKGLSLYGAKVIMIHISEDIKKSLQMDMMKSLIRADTDFIEKKHSGKIITNLINDVNFITALASVAILNLFKDTFTLIGLLTVMFYQNWKLSFVAIIMIPLASFFANLLGKRITKVTIQAMDKASIVNTYLIELFKNHKLIKIFQKETYESARADAALKGAMNRAKKLNEIYARSSPIMEVLTGIMIAILIFYSGNLIIKDELGINNFFSFLAAMMLAYQPVRSLATLNITINQGLAGARRILPVIDLKEKIVDNPKNEKIQIDKGDIEFQKINFDYDNESKPVLKDMNLIITGGKMTSLVGHSGAGKTTILNLIPRFYDPKSGDIKIDNQSIYTKRLSSLRNEISLVSQETTLFDDTVLNNIKYANLDASETEIREAAKLSYCEEFIESLPNKYDTLIGENGIRLSGGEKQRLSIARAILKKSKIILLDEATSSLDSDTEEKIQGAINYLTKDRTTLVIAHRLSTILNSNKIYVIDKGKVIGEGKHEELVKSSDVYKNFYEKQIQKN